MKTTRRSDAEKLAEVRVLLERLTGERQEHGRYEDVDACVCMARHLAFGTTCGGGTR